jgi:hypothetical protein
MASSSQKGKGALKAVRLDNGAFRIPGILSYPYLFSPQKSDKGDPKYSMNLIVPKTVDLSELEDAIDAAKVEKWGKNTPKKLREPIRDGSEYDDKAGYDDKVIFFTARNERKPFVVDKNRNDIDDKDEIYPGCKVLAVVRPYAYDNESRGIGMSLQGIIKVGDGERLGAAPMTADDAMEGLDAEDFPDDDEIPF